MVQLDPAFRPDHEFHSVEGFLAQAVAPVGCVRIALDRAPLDFRYLDKGYSRLAVFFTAAVPKDSTAPRFTGFGVSREVPANSLHFADPAVALTPELFLAWYTGWAHQPVPQIIRSIVQRYRDWTNPGAGVPLYGGSAGGFASLVCGHGLDGCVSIAANPQTNLVRYNRPLVERWRKVCWGAREDDLGEALKSIPAVTDVVALYTSTPMRNRVVVLQNRGDTDHVDQHFRPFREALEGSDSMRCLIGDWGDGHKPPPAAVVTEVLNLAISADWGSDRWAESGYQMC